MQRKRKKVSIVLIGTLVLALCTTACSGHRPSTETTVGALGGAAAGGLLGAAIGDSAEATAAGVILGGLLGAGIGEYLSQRDRQYMADTTYDALENRRSGEEVEWVNPDSGHSGAVVPSQAFQTAQGENCRNFTQTVNVQGQAKSGQGTACRTRDGSWRIVQ